MRRYPFGLLASQRMAALAHSVSPLIASQIASHRPSKVNATPHSCDMADLIGKPPGFWNHPGTPTAPWTRWLEDFETYVLAAGGESFSAERKAALLKTLLGADG
ncbi:hypothetical protein HPB50_000014 [Hyalomma asiaticum]|uniref:Uncharacterized protein n=1 Tax=Hyalomma asiaticum TaxID=266040 RepID=A0ACB7S0G7_HYAAI|nr:hypothetical protein HPB50_000014 [Hyalomma asiaticum]